MHNFDDLNGFWTEQTGDAVFMGDANGAALLVVRHASAAADLLDANQTTAPMEMPAVRSLVDQMALRWTAAEKALQVLDDLRLNGPSARDEAGCDPPQGAVRLLTGGGLSPSHTLSIRGIR